MSEETHSGSCDKFGICELCTCRVEITRLSAELEAVKSGTAYCIAMKRVKELEAELEAALKDADVWEDTTRLALQKAEAAERRCAELEAAVELIKSRAEQTLHGRKQGAGKIALAELDNIVKHCNRVLTPAHQIAGEAKEAECAYCGGKWTEPPYPKFSSCPHCTAKRQRHEPAPAPSAAEGNGHTNECMANLYACECGGYDFIEAHDGGPFSRWRCPKCKPAAEGPEVYSCPVCHDPMQGDNGCGCKPAASGEAE